jgi:hypothetical protein
VTKAHSDRIVKNGSDKGYSIRVGKTLPVNSANLAYVATPEMSPAKNLQINDLSANIKENGLPGNYEKERMMYPTEDFLLRELNGYSKLPSKRITLTDEFSVPQNNQEKPMPLYYRATAKGMFDANGALVSPYLSGYHEKAPEEIVDYAQVDSSERENLLYLGTKIKITNLDGTPLKTDQKYKIHLVAEEGEGVPTNAYNVYIYTNFRGNDNETFIIRYEKYNEDGTHTSDYTEIMNAYAFFEQVDKYYLDNIAQNPKTGGSWREELKEKSYTIVETEDNEYEVYAPSQVLVANNITRPAHQFKYRVKADLKAKLSNANPGAINIGMAFLNTSIINVEDLTGTMKKLHEDGYRPPYLDFINPVPEQKSYLKENPRYWTVDLSMPMEEWNHYDLVIISGYGYYNMAPYNDAIRNYLENGGKLWIDNAGEIGKVLTFKNGTGPNTFLTNIGFSNTENVPGFKTADANMDSQELLSRLYVLNGATLDLGYNHGSVAVNPKITFGDGESINNWTKIVRYSNNEGSVIKRTMYGKGTILVSNCGIFRSLFYGKDSDIKFIMNTILTFAEKKWVFGPWQQDYVYHRDNLFTEEYTGAGGTTVYVDDRNDLDSSQIVAKKIISKSTRATVLPHMPASHFSARGTYEVEVQSNTEIMVPNSSFEVGKYDSTAKVPVTEWTLSTSQAIPGWSTKHLAGSTPLFKHVSSSSQRGSKAISVEAPADGVGSHSYWSHTTTGLVAGSYRGSVWLKVENVGVLSATGATVGVYDTNGVKIATGTPLLGTRDWVEVQVNFSLESTKSVELRVGFVDGNGYGKVLIDYVSVHSVGSVYMTPANDGANALYAYAVRPRGETFDLRAQGFSTADITTYDPEIEVDYTIRAFVYAWDDYAGRYMRLYGNYVTEKRKIRRSDGIVSFGSLSTMIPALNAGADWADRNDVYYEVYLGGVDGANDDSRFVNLEIYDAQTGRYFYSKDGEVIIRYMDLFYEGENKNILLQARTNYYTIRATKRRYGVMVEAENKIELAYPSTIDNRDAWYLRVKNGSFVKKELNYNDIKALLAYDNRYYEFQQRLFGTHYYSLPEYNRQVFKPSIGIKRVREEIAEYVNDTTIKVQDAPLYVQQGSVQKELLTKADSQGLVYRALNGDWSKTVVPRVYVDENMNGTEVEFLDGFDIDYVNGLVIFENPVNGTVKVDYDYNNLEVWKRTNNNVRVRAEELETSDKRTFASNNQNWFRFPTPIVRVTPYDGGAEKIAPVTSYTIDYSSGVVTFKEDVYDIVTVDYTCSTDKRLVIRDFDARNGYIYLEEEIDFKHEIYVNYYYEENFLEYRGYYDTSIGQFIHLDLNPSEGHYCTMPVVRTDENTGVTFTSWEKVPTAKLMNKEAYVYVLPYKDSFGNYNEHTVRHCYGLPEWQTVQKANPTAMLLGIIQLREHTNVREAVVMDARSRGGGLKQTVTEADMKRVQPLSRNYWDMSTWDGTAYYKNGVLIIELPKKVLETQGGQFTEQEVKDIVSKYVAYGIYFIIEYV